MSDLADEFANELRKEGVCDVEDWYDPDDDLLNPKRCVPWRCFGCWTDVLIAWDWPVISPLAMRAQKWWMGEWK